MNQKLLSKVLATTLAVILTFTNFIMLGIYTNISYASLDDLENQTTVSNNENIKFDAYFMNEGNKTHTVIQDIDDTIKLYLLVNVEKGYLKNAKIQMQGEDKKDTNFQIANSNSNLEAVENIDVDKKIISLKQVNTGTQIILNIPVASKKAELFDLSDFNKINDITLTGTYVNNSGETVAIEKTIKVRNEWKKEVKTIVEQETKAYIPYEIDGMLGTILQTVIKTGLENNNLPLKQTQISVNVPQLNGKKPEEVLVISNNTTLVDISNKDTNTENKTTSNTWKYNKETGILKIIAKNDPNEDGKVVWNKEVKDEYTITYIYKEKIEQIEASQKAEITIESYNNVETKQKEENTLNIKETQNKGNFVTTEVLTNNDLSKGYLYTKTEKEVEYNETKKITIAYSNLVDKIILENNSDNFVNSDESLSKISGEIYYKRTVISKENFEKILGQDGYIKIIGKDGEILATFTKETVANENGNYVYEYENKIDEIKIETSKPIQIGTLEINNVKVLKGKTDYDKAQIENFKKLQLKTVTKVEYANKNIESTENIKEINLIEPSTKIEVGVNKENLSTIVKNENVEFRVVLKTNDVNCDLYKNPIVEIVLPNYIKELNIKEVNLLFDDELVVAERKTYVNENGNIVIQLTIRGEQTRYSQNEISKGANIVINTDITLKKLTPTKDDVVKAYVTNELATSYENTEQTIKRTAQTKAYGQTNLRAVAPTGVVTTTTISGYNSKNETVTVVNENDIVGTLDAKSESRTATLEMQVINNYDNIIKNIQILGRMPVEGNKSPETNSELASNFSTIPSNIIVNNIDNEKYTIYYSENAEATNDISLSTNGWTSEMENIANAKSYLIVFNDYEMNSADNIEFKYNITIPDNLEYERNVYTNYVVYFDNVKENETIKDKQIASVIGLSTKAGPKMDVTIKSTAKEEIEEGKLITYEISVRNTGDTVLNNVTLSGNVPEGTIYTTFEGEEGTEDPVTKVQFENIKEYSKKIEKLEPEEIQTITYQVETKGLDRGTPRTIEVVGKAKAEEYDAEFKSETITTKIIEGYLDINMEISPSYTNKREGQTYSYVTTIKNVNSKPKEEVVVTANVPDGVSVVSANEGGNYDQNTKKVTWNIGTINGQGAKLIVLTVKINEFRQGQSMQEISNAMNIKTKDKEITTNEIKFTVTKPVLTITQNSRTKEKVSIGEIIEYNVTIKNVGEAVASNVVVRDFLPNGLLYRGSTYVIGEQTYESWLGNTDATINIPTIKPGETVDITIKALVEKSDENKLERRITNIVGVSADDMKSIGSNEVTHTIVRKSEVQDPTVEEPIEGTFKISGLAWLDENADGKRDDIEEVLRGIEVVLVNSETGKIVVDKVTGQNKTQTTNEAGMYTFANIEPGKYLVVFLYDTLNYGVTKYKQDGVIEDRNSDVIAMNVTINGQTKLAGVANSIEITTNDITNIDMGLITSPKFDLKLNKTISKITVNNSKGTKEYTYDNAKFAKIDLKKEQIQGTTIVIEYKISVINEGTAAGYVKKIVDYMPKDMKFTSELNSDWYEGESGNLYNSKLSSILLQPGETKELKLVLTKTMTNDNTGTINNVAEIYEVSNDLGLADIDSTPGNRVQDEDDISTADVVIGVKTGEIYVYMLITFTSIIILGLGIYFINKKVLAKI